MANDPSLIVARYVEGLLEGDELARFERDLAASPALRAELEAMHGIDASMKRAFTFHSDPIDPPHSLPHRRPRRALQLLAAAAMIAIGAAIVFFAMRPAAPHEFNARDLYTGFINAGYQPKWVCASEDEFITYSREHLGQALRPTPPPSIQLVGWAYAEELKDLGFDKYAVVILTRVDGTEVLGVFDPTATGHLPADPKGKLHIFPQTLGPLTMYEVSPLDTPRIAPAMTVIPGDTMDIRTGPTNTQPRIRGDRRR